MENLPGLDQHDHRIGVAFFTARQLADMHGKSVAGIQSQLGRLGIRPAAFVTGTPAFLFAAEDMEAHGLLPDRPFDPQTEAWGRELADKMGMATTSEFLHLIAVRYGRRAGLGRPATARELAEAGIIRRFGRPWAYDRARVTELLSVPYDPDREATTAELLAQYGHFSNAANLARALRGHVKNRKLLDLDGRDRVVWDRAGAAEFFAGRNRASRARRAERPQNANESVWRDRIGPFTLRAPTQRMTVDSAEAQWLLEASPGALETLLKGSRDARVPGETGIAIVWLEATLVSRCDLEGLLLLARVVDGLLVLDTSLDRTAAMLSVIEKAA